MKIIPFIRKGKSLNQSSFRALRPYTQGPAVRHLQQNLNRRFRALGVSNLIAVTVDGWFGNETVTAVKYLQCASGLPVNGHVNLPSYAFIIHGFSGLETLSLGCTGTSVLALKQVLSARNHVPIPLDDVFCDITQQALKRYQRSMGLLADGVVGEKTWAVIVRSRLGGLACISLLPNVYVNVSPDVGQKTAS